MDESTAASLDSKRILERKGALKAPSLQLLRTFPLRSVDESGKVRFRVLFGSF